MRNWINLCETILYRGPAKFYMNEVELTLIHNPSVVEFNKLMKASRFNALRGLWDGDDLWIWDADLACHADICHWATKNGLRIDGADMEFEPSAIVMNSFYPMDARGNLLPEDEREPEAKAMADEIRKRFGKYFTDPSITLTVEGTSDSYAYL